jgi:hypothetical protein
MAAVWSVSCGGRKAEARQAARGFYEALCANQFETAATYVCDEDYTAFYEKWKALRARVAGVETFEVAIQLDAAGTGARAALQAKRARAGTDPAANAEETADILAVDMQYVAGRWRVRPVPAD